MTQDLLELRLWFGIELLDPITNDIVSRDLQVSLESNPAQPIISSSGRFAWRSQQQPVPPAVLVTSANRNYGTRRYPLQLAPLPVLPLLRFALLTSVSYPFTTEITLIRGRLVEVAGSDQPGIARAEISLRWFDRVQDAWQAKDGPRCVSSAGGYFAAALPLPQGARPKREFDQSLSLSLSIERHDLSGPPQQRSTPVLASIFESRQHMLPADIVWNQL